MMCANCGVNACFYGDKSKAPSTCPMKDQEIFDHLMDDYLSNETNRKIAYNSAKTGGLGFEKWTRLEEIIDFAERSQYKKLGLAFCIALKKEARATVKILQKMFTVYSVNCKTGAFSKEMLGITENEKFRPGHIESMCNPLAQAKLFNKVQTDLNIMLGLCVGHDTLFIKHSEAPITVFADKDRVLAHNPLGVIYCDYFYGKRFNNT